MFFLQRIHQIERGCYRWNVFPVMFRSGWIKSLNEKIFTTIKHAVHPSPDRVSLLKASLSWSWSKHIIQVVCVTKWRWWSGVKVSDECVVTMDRQMMLHSTHPTIILRSLKSPAP